MSHSHDHSDDLDLSILEQMGYEDRDLKVEKTGGLGVYFFGFVLVMIFAAWGIVWLMQPDLAGRPHKEQEFKRLPGADYPLLQSNATAQRDMIDMRAAEKKRMSGYGWTDDAKTTAHIPLDRAMDLVLEEGLPTAPDAREMKKPKPDPAMFAPADEHETPADEHSAPAHNEEHAPAQSSGEDEHVTGGEAGPKERRRLRVPGVGGAGGGAPAEGGR